MKGILIVLLLICAFGLRAQQYCVVGTGRLVGNGREVYTHVAAYMDSTIDLSQRIDQDTIVMSDVIFYFVARKWDLHSITQMEIFGPGEYFILIFKRED